LGGESAATVVPTEATIDRRQARKRREVLQITGVLVKA
jgi:hypothetical protein